jgi:hypothetical protein
MTNHHNENNKSNNLDTTNPPTSNLHRSRNRTINLHPLSVTNHNTLHQPPYPTSTTTSHIHPNFTGEESRSDADDSTTPIASTSTTSGTSNNHNSMSLPLPPPSSSPRMVTVPALVVSDNIGIITHHIPTMNDRLCRVPDHITLNDALRCHPRWDDVHSMMNHHSLGAEGFSSMFGHPQRRCRSLPEILDEALEISDFMITNLSTMDGEDQYANNHGSLLTGILPHHVEDAPVRRRRQRPRSFMSQHTSRNRRTNSNYSSSGNDNNEEDDSSQQQWMDENQ